MEEKLIGRTEAMEMLGVKASHFRKLTKENGVIAVKKGLNKKHIYFQTDEIRQMKDKLNETLMVI